MKTLSIVAILAAQFAFAQVETEVTAEKTATETVATETIATDVVATEIVATDEDATEIEVAQATTQDLEDLVLVPYNNAVEQHESTIKALEFLKAYAKNSELSEDEKEMAVASYDKAIAELRTTIEDIYASAHELSADFWYQKTVVSASLFHVIGAEFTVNPGTLKALPVGVQARIDFQLLVANTLNTASATPKVEERYFFVRQIGGGFSTSFKKGGQVMLRLPVADRVSIKVPETMVEEGFTSVKSLGGVYAGVTANAATGGEGRNYGLGAGVGISYKIDTWKVWELAQRSTPRMSELMFKWGFGSLPLSFNLPDIRWVNVTESNNGEGFTTKRDFISILSNN